MIRRILTLLATVSAVVVLTPVASAQPPPEPDPGIPLTSFGSAQELDLKGTDAPSELEIPVPQGQVPAVLSGQVDAVVNVVDGRVDVTDGAGTYLGSFPAPAGPGTTPFTVDVTRARIVDGTARLRLQLRDDRGTGPAPNACSSIPSLRLDGMTVRYLGDAPNPATVADFLPKYLDRAVIRVGTDPTPEIQQAALDLVARLTALYQPVPVRVDVDSSAGGTTPSGPDIRTIEIVTQPQASITVRDAGSPTATLVIAGTGPGLQNQIELFADRRADLIQSPAAAVTSATPSVPKATRVMTFGDLGMTSQATVLGTSTLYTGFDSAAFEVGPVEAAEVHLVADHTPVVGGEGSVIIRSGSTVLASQALGDTGKLDTTFTVPADAVMSKTGLAMDIRYVPQQDCAPLTDGLTFALDPSSTVSVTPGTRNRGGFPALPMAFTPEFTVALGSPAQLRYAAEAINLMGQQSQSPLRPVVRPFDEAVSANSPLLVVADDTRLADTELGAPVQPGTGSSLTVNSATVTAIDSDSPLGAIQAFTSGGRSVLTVSGSGDWSLVDRTFDHIWQLENRWGSLSGDVLATGARNDTVNLTVREGGSIPPLPDPAAGWRWWTWMTIGIAAAAVIAVGLTLLLRRRRRDG